MPNGYELKYRQFIRNVDSDPFNVKMAEFDLLFYLGTRAQPQFVDAYIRALRTEIVCTPKESKCTKM